MTTPAFPRDETPVSQYVPLSHHVTPTILATRNWEYLSVWHLDGRTFQGYGLEDQARWVHELNNVLRGLSTGFGLWSHFIRRRVFEYPESDYPDSFSRAHDAAYRKVFAGQPPMINEMYLTVLTRAQVDPALRLLSQFEKRTAAAALAWQTQAIDQLDEINRKFPSALKRYGPHLLGVVDRNTTPCADDPQSEPRPTRFSEAAAFFGYLLNGKMTPVPLNAARLYNTLPSCRQFFSTHGEQAEIRGPDWTRRFVMVELREYSPTTRPGHLDGLLNLPHEFIVSQSFGSMSKADGLRALSRQIKWLEDSGDYSASQIAELRNARDDLSAGKFVMGDHHATIQVFGEDGEAALHAAADIIGTLANEGVIARLVDRSAIAAWAAQLPGNWTWRPRPAPITSLNFLCYSSMHNFLFGKPAGNPWGPAVTMLKSSGGTPYYLNFHNSASDTDETGKRRLGNTSIIGQSGMGKTVFLAHAIAQARKFHCTVAIFDKDCGLANTVLAMNGAYFRLRLGVATGWNYLQLEPNPRTVDFMGRLTKQLAANDDAPATLSEQKQVDDAVNRLVEFVDLPERRLSTLLQFLPAAPAGDGRLSLRDRLERWCVGHDKGWLFDNPRDELDLASTALFGFDLTELLAPGPIRDSAITYLTFRTEAMNDGRRFMYVFDEVQHPLRVEYFQEFIQDKNRTIRKQNGILLIATQEPAAVLDNPIGRSLVQQSATSIYFANPKGSSEDYIEGFKLTPAEFEMVRALPEFGLQFVVKQGSNAVIAQLDLSACPESLLVFGGSEDTANIAEEMRQVHGTDPDLWLPHYIERAGALARS